MKRVEVDRVGRAPISASPGAVEKIDLSPYSRLIPRFEMLLGTKEHEMHHRGQLMLIERLLGIVPHLTRDRQAARAAAAKLAPVDR